MKEIAKIALIALVVYVAASALIGAVNKKRIAAGKNPLFV